MRDLVAFIVWWLIVTGVGMLAWPLLFRMLPQLPERGYALSKTCGLLLLGYMFWILSSLGYLRMTFGGVLIAGLILAVVSMRWGQPRAAIEWLSSNRALVLATEVVFLTFFGAWSYVRALNPEIVGTEKPMEFAFLNSVLRSGSMPSLDPWLSGYAISYYYFGYVIIGILTQLSGVLPSVAFNLAVALLFGLSAVGSFGVTVNLMVVSARAIGRNRRLSADVRSHHFVFPALLAPVFTLLTGNLNGLLEMIHQRGIGAARFWQWLDIKWLDSAPITQSSWLPERYMWWWQASRVIRDRDLSGSPIGLQPIEEFPFFSFLLGDLHPHVLGLPAVFLILGLALQIFLHASNQPNGVNRGYIIPMPMLMFVAFVLGGLAFLNTWDFPIYLFVVVAAYAIGRGGISSRELMLGLTLASLGILLYLPFYIGFRSQASGILPNPVFSTQLNQFAVMFGVLLVPAIGWQVWEATRAGGVLNWRLGAILGPGLVMVLVLACVVLTMAITTSPNSLDIHGTSSLGVVVSDDKALRYILHRRLIQGPWLVLMLAGILFLTGAMLPSKDVMAHTPIKATSFVLLLAGVGYLLVLVPEFLYLRDSFGVRMNTMFKFYYQAWTVWSIVAAYGCWCVCRYAGKYLRGVFALAVTLSLACGLIYSVLSVWTKTVGMQGTTLEFGERVADLDGMKWMASSRADDYAAIIWLNKNVVDDGVIAEAVGGSYSEYGRVSAYSGMPTILGWPGHELQWRGGFDKAIGREDDVRMLYSTRDWNKALAVIELYDIRYVYVGSLEREQFPEYSLMKFEDYMRPMYRNGDVTIYERLD